MAGSISPIGPRVVAQQKEAKKKTASGIYLPTGAQEKPQSATVLSVGAGVSHVKKGDEIIYKEYSATEIKVDGEAFLIVNIEDVLATIS